MSNAEEDQGKTPQTKSIFVNYVDSYQGRNFAKVCYFIHSFINSFESDSDNTAHMMEWTEKKKTDRQTDRRHAVSMPRFAL